MQKTLGGDRLGSGKKQKVNLHGYERSTHDLSYIWRSTMAAGTLVPFMSQVALPGDTFDINLGCEVMTHPTIGPLMGSYKVQLDVFMAPIRLYNAQLHNNSLGIGLDMEQIKLPKLTLTALPTPDDTIDLDNSQINPSSLLSYLGIRGIGRTGITQTRSFNAVPTLAYWEIYKQYYANKQEENGAVIHTPSSGAINETIDFIKIATIAGEEEVPEYPLTILAALDNGAEIRVGYTGAPPLPTDIVIKLAGGNLMSLADLCDPIIDDGLGLMVGIYNYSRFGYQTAEYWRYRNAGDNYNGVPEIAFFPLTNIDEQRKEILSYWETTALSISDTGSGLEPYKWLTEITAGVPGITNTQEGLGLKTYQSDLFNNWIQTEWIDGVNGISAVTAVDTTGGSFTLDTLNLSKKVYDMLNRIAVSGGTYDDWLDVTYDHERYTRCESPMYMGGLSKELVFQEVVSNSASSDQPLGTLAGKGTMAGKHKGGSMTIKVDEPSYIIGIVSLTPRLDYSQGNQWDVNLQSLNDLHKPALDEIGFQELIQEQMAWWTTNWDSVNSEWVQQSAGKQPAWLNYMTNVNQTRGNFAVPVGGNGGGEMFMTLNRRYTPQGAFPEAIQDLTTYIDPSLYNNIFAETSLDSQNFWTQISLDITARRKMSAKLMPNL